MPIARLFRPLPLALAALLLAGSGYAVWLRAAANGVDQKFLTAAVARGAVTQSVSANGTLNPVTLVSVGTQVSGTVRKIYADFNDEVKEGQVLMELDQSLLAAQVRSSAADLTDARAALELAEANLARARELFAREYVSRQEFDQALQARKSAAARLALASARLDKDRVNLDYTVIRSPVSGVVVNRVVDVGTTVAASFQTPTLFQIAQDLSKMQIDTSFAEADIGAIREGQAVRFSVDAFPNRSFRGQVRQIRLNPTVTSNVVTYNVVIAVDNPEQSLLPGMTAYVTIAVAERDDALLVPNAALRFRPRNAPAEAAADAAPGAAASEPRRGGGPRRERGRDSAAGTVYVLDGREVRAVRVRLGITDTRSTEVLAGELQPGDAVLVGERVAGGEAPAGRSVRLRMF
jgi:HlyD family secretion protein